jgi:hypothetical protein
VRTTKADKTATMLTAPRRGIVSAPFELQASGEPRWVMLA